MTKPGAVSGESLAGLIRDRRTIHEFEPGRTPPRELILRALDLARWSPNHHLTEPWHFYLLGPETVRAVSELNARLLEPAKGAQAAGAKLQRWLAIPGWVAVTCDRSADTLREREDYAACCCAVQNFMLYLWNEGVGVKWTTGPVTRDPAFYDLLWIDPEAESLVGLLWYGYPAEVPNPQRRPLESSLVELP